MKCPNCQYDNEAAASSCVKCGTPLTMIPSDGIMQDRRVDNKPVKGAFQSDFRRSLLKTSIPLVTLSLLSLTSSFVDGMELIWIAGALGFFVAVFIGIFNLTKGERARAAGVFSGIAIGGITLGITCIANLGNMF